MGVIFIDSFDGDANQMDRYQGGSGGYEGTGLPIAGGRNGTMCLNYYNSGSSWYIPAIPEKDFIAGFAVQIDGVLDAPLFSFQAHPNILCTVNCTSLAGFTVTDNAGAVQGSSPNGLYYANSWGHLQVKVTTTWTAISGGSLGFTCSVKFNNVLVVSGAVGALATPKAYIDELGFNWNCFGRSVQFDDFYIVDLDDGVSPTDYIGDLRVTAVFPNAVGTNTNWTPSTTGAQNWTMVDDNPDDEDTSYVSTTTVGAIDTYNFPDITLPPGSYIYGVMHNQVARKDNAGSRSIASVCLPTSTLYIGPSVSVGDTYDMYSHMWNKNPDTGADWTVAQFNAAQFGPDCTV